MVSLQYSQLSWLQNFVTFLGSLEAWAQEVKEPSIFSVYINWAMVSGRGCLNCLVSNRRYINSWDLQKTLALLTWTLLKSRGTSKIARHVNSFLSGIQKGFSWQERHTGIKYTTVLINQIGHIAVGYNSKLINNYKLARPSCFANMFLSLVRYHLKCSALRLLVTHTIFYKDILSKCVQHFDFLDFFEKCLTRFQFHCDHFACFWALPCY